MLVNLWLRGTRWAILMRPNHRVSGRAALGPVLISMGLNAVLPGRVGEVARISLGARRFGISLPFVASTVVVERLLDSVVLLAFIAVSLLTIPAEAGTTIELFGYSLSSRTISTMTSRLAITTAVLLAVLFLMSLESGRGRLRVIGQRVPRFGRRIVGWTLPRVIEATHGLGVLHRPRLLGSAIGISIVIWLALAVTNLMAASAFDGLALTLPQALVVTAVSAGASFLPSAPGGWGLYEAGMLLGLAMVHVVPEDPGVAVAFSLSSHLLTYLPVLVLGGLAGMRPSQFAVRESS